MDYIRSILQNNVVIYVGLVLISYVLYEVLKNEIPNKLKHFILTRSVVLLILTLVGGFIVTDNNLKQALFTFSSVYLGFWLNEQVKSQEERRKLKYFLGMIWQELRYNCVQLETLKENYKFFMDDERDLEIMFLKFSSINTHTGFLKSTVYDLFVSSSVITGLKTDAIFNDLATAYTNIRYLQSAVGLVLTDFEIKLKVHRYAISENGKDKFARQILKDLSKKIKNNAGKELAISYRAVCKAIDSVDVYLSTMMVKSDEEMPSDNDLTQEDEEFISNIIRKPPGELPENLFGD